MNAMTLAAGAALACTLDRKAFAAALALADKVTEARNTIPILSTVRLAVACDSLTVEATDLDSTITVDMAAAETVAGAICVDLKALRATVRKMTGATVRLQYVGGRMVVTDVTTGAATRLATLPVSDWPCIGSPESPCEFTLPADQLSADLARIRPAISTEETRYYLNGIHFHPYRVQPLPPRTPQHEALADELAALRALDQADVDGLGMCFREAAARALADAEAEAEQTVRVEEIAALSIAAAARCVRQVEIAAQIDPLEAERNAPDSLRMVATDGHRLHYVTRPLSEDMASLPPVILPRKAVAVALAIIGKKPAGDVAIAFSESRFALTLGAVRLRGKLIDGTFPDYTRVIPSQNEKRLVIGAADVAQLTGAATAHCSDRDKAVLLSLCAESVIFSATSVETGTAAAQAAGAEFDGEELAIGFNGAYLVDVAKQFGGATITVELADAAAPTLFRTEDPEFAAVLMPMRVGGDMMRPANIERLNRGPWEAFAEDIGLAFRDVQRGTGGGWSAVRTLIREARAALIGGGMSPIATRAAILAVIAPDTLKTRAASAMANTGEPRGTFGALSAPLPAGVVEPVEAESMDAAKPEPVEEPAMPAADDAPAVEEAPQPPPEPVQEPPAPTADLPPPPDAFEALATRVAALEALLRGQDRSPAEISETAPDPCAPDPAPIEGGERAELIAEIDALRATVAAQAATIDRLTSRRRGAVQRLGQAHAALKRERAMTAQLLGQVGDMLKRRGAETSAGDVEPLPPAIELPASLRPRAVIELPTVPRRARLVETV